MRHIFAVGVAETVGGLTSGVAEPTLPALLIAIAGGPQGRPARALRTGPRAVPLPAVTRAAEEEQSAAVPAGADDEAE
jgi:hypothetical protein